MGINYRNRAYISGQDKRIAEALDEIAQQAANIAAQVAANPSGITGAPPQIISLAVTASNGQFDFVITDNNPVFRGINYFIEYSTTANFIAPRVIDLGASRGDSRFFGNQTLYFRAYSSYPTSAPSGVVYFGSADSPTAVVGGGAVVALAPQTSTGSGTASSNGTQGGQGFGNQSQRGTPTLI